MRYFKNPKDEVHGYDETYEKDLPYIEAAIEAGWEDVTDSWPPLATEQVAPSYAELRAAAYPPMADYLDAVVKGDQGGIEKYVSECLAVKEKYPKP